MHCNNCGKEIATDSLFCRFCGKKITLLTKDNHLSEQKSSIEGTINRRRIDDAKDVMSKEEIKNLHSKIKLPHPNAPQKYNTHKYNGKDVDAIDIIGSPWTWTILFTLTFFISLFYVKDEGETLYVYLDSIIAFIIGMFSWTIGRIVINENENKFLDPNRLRKLTGYETAGGTINLIGITYHDTGKILPDATFWGGSLQYQFFSVFGLPLIPTGCQYVHVPMFDNSPKCTIYANCTSKFQEILPFYLRNWGLAIILISIICICIAQCNNNKNETRGTQDSIMLDTTTIAPLADPIVEQYKDNHLESLSQPYPNEIKLRGGTSAIKVSTYSGAEQDVIVIIKNHNDQIVRNSYLRPGDSVNMDVPSGTYQMFLYYGNGWCPEKVMPNGLTGGFVCDESFSKDDPVTLEQYQYVEYSLTPTTNGNFQTKHTDKNEVF